MSLPWISDDTLLWDTLIIGGEVWPGVPTVTVEATRAVDLQKKKGDDGANLVDQGYEPAKVTLTLRLWMQDQWDELQRLLPTVHPRRKGGIRTPVDIVHPATQLVGVRQIYITKIGSPTADKGVLTIVLDAVEWFPQPKPAKAKTKKSKAATGGADADGGATTDPTADGSAGENLKPF